jgi:hypothetical protein
MNMMMPIAAPMTFDPLDFFDAQVDASGIVVDIFGRVTRSFTARFEGVRRGSSIDIDETLVYDDGMSERRAWRIAAIDADSWSAAAAGLLGDPTIRRDPANPMQSRWTYAMDIPVKGRKLRFAMEDIMTLVEPGRIVALTPMKKFGIKIAHIASEYRRLG